MILASFLYIKYGSLGKTVESSSTKLSLEGKIDSTGKQIIEIEARGGYSPEEIIAKADVETVLRVNTRNTFDCSSAITIPKLNIQRNLPVTGSTDFDIGVHQKGEKLSGSCSMGMYGFVINFE